MEPHPDVIVDFPFEDGMLFVVVQNIGSQPALRVHVAFDPHSRGSAGWPLFRTCRCFATSNSLRLPAPFVPFWIPAPRTSPAKSLSRSPPLPLTPIGRGRNSRPRCSTISPSIATSRSFQNRKGLVQPMAILRDVPCGNQHFRVDLAMVATVLLPVSPTSFYLTFPSMSSSTVPETTRSRERISCQDCRNTAM
jgi:hypothetical protein